MQANLTWNASTGATSYGIYRSTTQNVQGSLIGTSVTTSYTDVSVASGTTYWYSVTARNVAGESAASTQSSVTTPTIPPPVPPQTITSFTVLPTSVQAGATVTLTWVTVNATSVKLNGIPVASSGSTTDVPAASKSYTLTASGSVPDVSQTVSVIVTNAPPPQSITTFTVTPSSIQAGQTVTIGWATQNAAAVTLNGTPVAASGTLTDKPTANKSYTLLVSGTNPELVRTLSVTVSGSPPPTGQAITTFTALPAQIVAGQSVTITWATTNATAVTLNGSPVAASGNTTVAPTVNTSYTLVASGSLPDVSSTQSVTVVSAPQTITTFTALPASINAGQTVTITWATTNATLVKLNGVTVANSGSTTDTPGANKTYTLTVSGSAPDLTQTKTVQVSQVAPAQVITAFSAAPVSIAPGASSVITWATTNATVVKLNGTTVGASGTQVVTPSITTTYTLVASGTAPDVSSQLTVIVTSGGTGPTWYAGQPRLAWIPIAGTKYQDRSSAPFVNAGLTGGAYGSYIQGVFTYSGGSIRLSDSTMLLFGGGGNTWGGNDVDAITLEDNAPSWRCIVNPAPAKINGQDNVQPFSNFAPNPYTLIDGTPNSRHSYWTPQYVAATNRLYIMGGAAPWPSDSGQWAYVDSVSLVNGVWTTGISGAHPSVPGSPGTLGPWVCKNALTDEIYYGTNDSVYRFTPSANTWSLVVNAGTTNVSRAAASLDYSRNVILRFGEWGGGTAAKQISCASGTISDVTFSGSQAAVPLANWPGAGVCYNPDLDAHVAWFGDGFLYTLKWVSNTNYAVEKLTLTGTPPQVRTVDDHLVLSHIQYVPNLQGICLITWYDENVFFVKTGPGGGTGPLSITTTAVNYPTTASRPFYTLGSSKHLGFAYLSGRWYKGFGDHGGWDPQTAPPMAFQDGRQEIGSLTIAGNDWVENFPYYDTNPAHVQQAFPDDGFIVGRGTEFWCFATATAHGLPPYQPAGVATQLWGRLMAWQSPNGPWRDVNAMPVFLIAQGGRAWGGYYDAAVDKFYIPAIASDGLAWVIVRGSDGADLTTYTSPGVPQTYGNVDVHVGGVAVDTVHRIAYMYDYHAAKLYKISLDAIPGALTFVTSIGTPVPDSGHTVQVCWHPGIGCVLIAFDNLLWAYNPTTTVLQQWNRQQGNVAPYGGFVNGDGIYVPPSAMFYDPATGDVACIGGVDFDTSIVSPSWWRLHFA